MPANEELTVFLLEMPGSPFGAAQYSGDVITNDQGRGRNEFELIVEEAFASTLVNGSRVRGELNHVGFWFVIRRQTMSASGPAAVRSRPSTATTKPASRS